MGGIEEVGYYYLYNGTVGTYIWPQLRHGDDIGRNIWNGRDYSGYGLNVGKSSLMLSSVQAALFSRLCLDLFFPNQEDCIDTRANLSRLM